MKRRWGQTFKGQQFLYAINLDVMYSLMSRATANRLVNIFKFWPHEGSIWM